MRWADVPRNPDQATLRQFGWIALPGFTLLGWIASGRPPLSTAWENVGVSLGLIAGGLCAVTACFRPMLLKPLFVVLVIATFPIGFFVGTLILALIYWGLFTPIAMVFRLIGRDVLDRRSKLTRPSYWRRTSSVDDLRRYFRQY